MDDNKKFIKIRKGFNYCTLLFEPREDNIRSYEKNYLIPMKDRPKFYDY